MDTMRAVSYGVASAHKEAMVFDWIKAATLIKLKNAKNAGAGLAGDWEWTGGSILRNGKPVPESETYTYLASTWAVPELQMDGEIIDCFKMQSQTPDWDAHTYWPPEALAILKG